MELRRSKWNRDSYKEFINYLFENRDIKYRDFHGSLGVDNVIGIRTGILRKIAKEIYRGNYKEFLMLCGREYYEEITIYGFIICNIKEIESSIYYLDKYKDMINNWASCDLFCSSYKIVSKNKEYYFKYIKKNIKSKKCYIKRLCFVLLLNYYIEEEYIEDIFELCDKYNSNDYYVEMSIAWLISMCYVKHKEKTTWYIKNNKLNDFTCKKIKSKIRDSYRVSEEDKEEIYNLIR